MDKFTGYFNYLKNGVLKTNYFEQQTRAQVAEKELQAKQYEYKGAIIIAQERDKRNRIYTTAL